MAGFPNEKPEGGVPPSPVPAGIGVTVVSPGSVTVLNCSVIPPAPAGTSGVTTTLLPATVFSMSMCSVIVPVASVFVAESWASYEPAVVGVPEITPVMLLIDKPSGSDVALNDNARVAVAVYENGVVTTPVAVDAL